MEFVRAAENAGCNSEELLSCYFDFEASSFDNTGILFPDSLSWFNLQDHKAWYLETPYSPVQSKVTG